MMIYRISAACVVLAMSATCVQARAVSGASHVTGVMHFTGLIYQPASASIAVHSSKQQESTQVVRTYSLPEAMNSLHSDLLDYFAGYAARNSSVVSATYE
jgi:hypothetical protein